MTATINNKAITISARKTVAGVAVVNGAAGMSGADYALIVRVGLSVLFIYTVSMVTTSIPGTGTEHCSCGTFLRNQQHQQKQRQQQQQQQL